jgi:DNA replication licensing factor MCM2
VAPVIACTGQRVIKSMAPAIYGHEFIKTGIAMALFGGVVSEGRGGPCRLEG